MQLIRIYFLITILSIIATVLKAQVVVVSQVVDIATDLPIEGANIVLLGTEYGTFTDADGRFSISLETLPSTIIISHLGYESFEFTISRDALMEEFIYLIPSSNLLEQVTIQAEYQPVSLSNVNKYSTIDFEIFNKRLIRLESHFSNGYYLTMSDLEGSQTLSLSLDSLKNIQRIFKSCNNNLYVVCFKNAHRVEFDSDQIRISSSIGIDTFRNLIETCKLSLGDKLYYQVEKCNGLQNDFTSYNVVSSGTHLIQSIYDPEQMRNYLEEKAVLDKSQNISNIYTNDPVRNRRIRRMQNDGDFYKYVFYKLKYPNFLFEYDHQVLIFNHHSNQIEFYDSNDQHVGLTKIGYTKQNKWLKSIFKDHETSKFYTSFGHKSGIALYEINLVDGNITLTAVIQSWNVYPHHIKVYENEIFYLKRKSNEAGVYELFRMGF